MEVFVLRWFVVTLTQSFYFYCMILQSVSEIKFQASSIVSLVPSQTELLYHLGLEKAVTGITKFCVHPAAWKQEKTIVGGTKNINTSLVKSICPDLIIANKEENEKSQVEELARDHHVWVTDVNNLEDALQMIKDIGQLTGTSMNADELLLQINAAFSQLTPVAKKIKTCYLIWKDPYMTVGGDTFINNMLLKCGFENMYAAKTRYPLIELSQLQKENCELLILPGEPYPFKEKHLYELQQQLPGIKIMLADGEMFSWYGSRLLKAAEYFQTLINNI